MANTVKTTFIGDTRPQDKAAAKLQADLARYKQQRERDEQSLTRTIEKEAESRYRIQVRNQQRATRDILSELRKIEREEDRITRERNARIRSGVSNAAPYALGALVGGGYLATQAIEKAVEQTRANRLLASAATEAGVGQDKLTEANKRYAASVGLSNAAAAQTTAQIQRLATYAGRPQDVDRLLKAFADLGAARGIGGRDLEGLIGTILSGQDEGLNRLGISDPGQLQKAYAESIGKTTEQLTQQEKVQAAVNAVLEKSAIFAGAAESRMNSLEGQVAKTSAAWENFTNALATTFTVSGPVTDFITEASRLIQGLSVDLDQVNRKLSEGKTPEQIARDVYGRPGAGDYVSAGVTRTVLDTFFPGSRLVLPQWVSDATDPQKVYERRFRSLQDQIAAQQQSNQQQETAAYQQQVDQARKAMNDLQRQQIESVFGKDAQKKQEQEFEKSLRLALSNPDVTLSQLQSGLKQVQGAALDPLTRQDFTQRYQKAIEEETKRQADELKKKLEEVRKAKDAAFDLGLSGSGNPFLTFLGTANQRMRSLLDTTQVLAPAIREAIKAQVQAQNQTALFGLRVAANVEADSYRSQAREFRQGFRNQNDPEYEQKARYYANLFGGTEEIIQANYEKFLAEERSRGFQANFSRQISAITRNRPRNADERSLLDQRLIGLGGDPEQLLEDQRTIIASAFEREANRKLAQEKEASDFYKSWASLIADGKGLRVVIADGQHQVLIRNEAPDNARVTSRPRSSDSATYYGN